MKKKEKINRKRVSTWNLKRKKQFLKDRNIWVNPSAEEDELTELVLLYM